MPAKEVVIGAANGELTCLPKNSKELRLAFGSLRLMSPDDMARNGAH